MTNPTTLPPCAYCGDAATRHPDGMHGASRGACTECEERHVPGVSRWIPCTGYVHPESHLAPDAPIDRTI